MLSALKSQFDKDALDKKLQGCAGAQINNEKELIANAEMAFKSDRIISLKSALLCDCKSRNEFQNGLIMKFLQQDSSFKTFFPEGSLFSKKDVETIRDGCRLKNARRGDVLACSGDFIDDVFVLIAGCISLENAQTGKSSLREAGDIIGVDALEKAANFRKNDVVAFTDVMICAIEMNILLKSVGVKVGSEKTADPQAFITKFWKSTNLWRHAIAGAAIQPLFPFLDPKAAGKTTELIGKSSSAMYQKLVSDSSEGTTSRESLGVNSDEGDSDPAQGTLKTQNQGESPLVKELEKIVSYARVRTYHLGDPIFTQYDYRHYLYIVVRGEAAYCRHLPEEQRKNAESVAPHEIEYGVHLYSDDYSFMDGESATEWITRRKEELKSCRSNHSKDVFRYTKIINILPSVITSCKI
jgi:CRP-like cAMP-binding protein